ncbi:platelet glycoprotein IX [Gouania willdenowi]|nr:platelet glycoprotein IX-like [Gouania willdenowi]
MLLISNVAVLPLFILATFAMQRIDKQCLSAHTPDGLQVICTALNLTELPHFLSNTSELYLQDNQLSFVPAGLFDRLTGLNKVSLSGNPFHCDCRIQYLRSWLLRNQAIVVKDPVCATPGPVAQKAITLLDDDYFSACALMTCADGMYNTVLGVMLLCLIALLLCSLRLARRSTFTLVIDGRHQGFCADSLQSLKPKHRRRLHVDLSSVSGSCDYFSLSDQAEMPLIKLNRPHVVDVLHKKQQMKVKST